MANGSSHLRDRSMASTALMKQNGLVLGSDDLAYHPLGKWTVTTSIEYHWVDYSAEADWNLRDDFQHPKSFEHEAYGDGWVAGVGVNYALNQQFSLGLSGDYLSWNTDSGTDRLYLANGSIVDTRLNEVNWESKLLSVTLDLVF
jgi:hypothetical protein